MPSMTLIMQQMRLQLEMLMLVDLPDSDFEWQSQQCEHQQCYWGLIEKIDVSLMSKLLKGSGVSQRTKNKKKIGDERNIKNKNCTTTWCPMEVSNICVQ